MVRAVIGCLLALSVCCKSNGDSPKAQPGVAAGKVLEVTGTVTLRHGDVARPLASGDSVAADDTIETGADGHAIIELTHNLAKWELGANKKQVVRESMAWKLAKNDGTAKPVDQDTSAAGRPAERSAAETGATAPAAEAAPAPAAAAPPAAPPVEERKKAPAKVATKGMVEGKASASVTKDVAPRRGGEAAVTAAEAPAAPGGPSAYDQVVRETNAIKKCLTKDMPEISLTITISPAGVAKVGVEGSIAVPGKIRQCVTGVVQKIKFSHEAATVKLQISR